MKIYTKKGDGGETHLATGGRVAKDNVRVDLYGNVDELNSHIGLTLAFMESPGSGSGGSALTPPLTALADELTAQQSLLFELGSELAGFRAKDPDTGNEKETVFFDSDVESLEQAMDRMSADLEPMRAFILPGGRPAAAQLHLCRTVSRRIERMMVGVRNGELANQDEQGLIVHDRALRYMNRISDYFFMAARFYNHVVGVEDIKWKSRSK